MFEFIPDGYDMVNCSFPDLFFFICGFISYMLASLAMGYTADNMAGDRLFYHFRYIFDEAMRLNLGQEGDAIDCPIQSARPHEPGEIPLTSLGGRT